MYDWVKVYVFGAAEQGLVFSEREVVGDEVGEAVDVFFFDLVFHFVKFGVGAFPVVFFSVITCDFCGEVSTQAVSSGTVAEDSAVDQVPLSM